MTSNKETKDMKDLFRWMNDQWKPGKAGKQYYRWMFAGKSKTFKKNQRKGL